MSSRALTWDITQAGSLVELQDLVEANAGQLNAIHVSAIVSRAAALAQTPKAALEARQGLAGLVPLWLQLVPDAPTMSAVSTLLLAASKLSIHDPQLWSTTLAHVMEHKLQTTGFDVTNIMYSIALTASANRGQIPGVQRAQVVDYVRTLLRRLLAIVQRPREGDRLALVSITNSLCALTRLGTPPTAEQLQDLLVAATQPRLFGEVNANSYSSFVWALAVLQSESKLFGVVKIPPSAEAAILAPDKVALVHKMTGKQLAKTLYSLGLLVQTGAMECGAAAKSAGLVMLADLETRPDVTAEHLAAWLWGAAMLGLPVKRLLTPDVLQQLEEWAPRAKGQYIAPLAELLVLTGCQHDGIACAALQAARTASPRVRPDEALADAAAVGSALAHLSIQDMARQLMQLLQSKPEVRKPGVACTPHTKRQLQATHAWLCQQQQVRGGRGLAGLVHPSLLQGVPGGAGGHAPGPGNSSSGGGAGSSSRQQTVPRGQKHSGIKKHKAGQGGGSSPRPAGSSGMAGGTSGKAGSSSAAPPRVPAGRVPVGPSSRQLLPRPQR
jgi:hypothetical protein